MSESLITDCEGPENLPRSTAVVVSLLFVLLVGGMALIDGVFPQQGPVPVGGERRKLDRQARQANLADGSLARYVEVRLRMRSRVRQMVVPYWSAFLLQAAGEGLHPVIVGQDNMLFIRRRVEILPLEADALVDVGARHVAAVERRLETLGTRLIVMPVPRKAAVAADHLPPGVDGRVAVDRAFIDRLQAGGTETVDLLAAWSDMSADQVYMRYDSHWNASGQIAAARACAATIGAQPSADLGLKRGMQEDEEAKTLQMIGIPPQSRAARLLPTPTHHAYHLTPPARDSAARDRAAWQDKVIVGSSFTQGRDFSALVSYEVGEVVWEQGYLALPFMAHLTRFLRRLADRPLPALIWWELPVHQGLVGEGGFDRLTRESVGTFWAGAPSTPGYRIDATPTERVRASGNRFTIRGTVIATTGDGVVGLRLRGDGLAGTRWRYASRQTWNEFVWPKGAANVLLPVIHAGSTPANVTLQCLTDASAPERVTLEIEIVGAPRTVASGAVGSAQRGQQLPRRTELLTAALPVAPHSALLIEAAPQMAGGALEVVARTDKGDERTWPITSARGGVVVLSLHPLAGETLDSIEIRTAGSPALIQGRPWRVVAPSER